MSGGWLIFNDSSNGLAKQAALKVGRLQAVYGGDYSGQTVWPDNITTEAVRYREHPISALSAVQVGDEAFELLTTPEKAVLQDNDTMEAAGWFE